ncbi:hypothetical protein CJ030_MR0G003207 [Morella rubra]|uniref:Myb/SANT-like domain-containing protein n=1 Tax=Morella rubra TaxID=262757 RepID=A0A6A1UR16_9ROSI|nr:hypothetical protein CJ030_MR0G003207 [Morella rubra]
MAEEETKALGAWPPRDQKIFIKLLADEVTRGNQHNVQFKRDTWKKITTDLAVASNHAYTVKQVKGKFNLHRTMHREF